MVEEAPEEVRGKLKDTPFNGAIYAYAYQDTMHYALWPAALMPEQRCTRL